jgi:16S rRNA processing protein RimM
VVLGSVRGAYGVKGWVRIALFGDDTVLRQSPQWWLQGLRGTHSVAPEEQRRHGAALLAKWTGCESKEAADALKGVAVAVPRSAFPPAADGEFYWSDLAGCRVVNRGGEALGEVSGLRENAGGQWLEVSDEAGGNVLLVPLVAQYVDAVDPVARVIRVDWKRDW